jgi:DNA-binding response OmpR family regulator
MKYLNENEKIISVDRFVDISQMTSKRLIVKSLTMKSKPKENEIHHKEIIIPKEQLFNRIWGFDCDTIWSVVEVYVSNLRKTLKQYDYSKYLKTLRNVGYMWSEKE